MKKRTVFGVIVAITFAVACANSENREGSDDPPGAENTADISANPDYQKGLQLVAGSDCLTCHKIEEKVTGPSYKDIAKKYAGQSDAVDYLSKKIISGGSGVWGSIPMLPHPALSQADAEAMAKYVLLLK